MNTTMEIFNYFCIFFFISFLLYKLLFKPSKNLPPSPLSLPISGHVRLLKRPPLHRTLNTLSDQYGPYLYLKFGLCRVLVVSSPSGVEQCFTKNDIVFANRPRFIAGECFGYNFTSLGWAPYGHHWRNLRRVANVEIFSSHTLQMSAQVRNEEIKFLIKQFIQKSSSNDGFVKIDMRALLFELMFNVMKRIVDGNQCFGREMGVEERRKLRERLKDTFVPNITMNLGDLFPIFRWFSFIGLEKKLMEVQRKRDRFVQGLIDATRSCRGLNDSSSTKAGEKMNKTVIDSLLKLQEAEPEVYSEDIIKGLLGMMFTAGTDTTSLTIEWAMALLLNHPEVLYKVRDEIDNHTKHQRLLDESDVAKLPYLQSVINETIRLYPVGPLLVPHASSAECNLGGYTIPRGTVLMVNAWAIHRDPKVWEDPTKFKPERFSNGVQGRERELGFKFIPFGLGRRRCPGEGMAMRVMGLALGSFIQCFEWERVGHEQVDMTEGSGTTMPKAKPLEAMFRPRPAMMDILSQL